MKSKCATANQLISEHQLPQAPLNPPDDLVIEQLSEKFAVTSSTIGEKHKELERKVEGQGQIEQIEADVNELTAQWTAKCEHGQELLRT
jgi:hypothetical protein